MNPGLFASCLYVQIDLAGRRACLATAGHLPPLLRGPDGSARPLDVPPGLLLGIEPASDYRSVEYALPSGAVLALFTDGLVEQPGTDLDVAIDDLVRSLAAGPRDLETLADQLMNRARPYGDRTDDTALFLLRPAP
ncbi:PP2C family protein-serine/threonine phosphatase [Streptomyces peucetius]|uniref:Serine/threonine-protein phosphatase n=1 Tax=Streptomyces peucetius TaxID=1950 RepID=A0ABY6IIG4_STRPE|nr:PP2C family protein-serine/threonine phosphatase [Streptomyces peucetius]UYQ66783.1 serine/threonine-protein phosphatase [Streptomyces peucetius]